MGQQEIHPLIAAVREAWPLSKWQDVTVLVAVSGGADSVALLRAVYEIRAAESQVAGDTRGRVCVAHFHHGTRPSNDDDATFVEDLANELGVPFVFGRHSQAATEHPPKLKDLEQQPQNRPREKPRAEEPLRNARYAFLRQAAAEHGARYVATAHTVNDNVETVLHRIIRGTSLPGLGGIPKTKPLLEGVALIRPMLKVTRQEVLSYLKEIGQPYREDPTNAQLDYTRNYIRHELLPTLRDRLNPKVDDALLRLSRHARETGAWLDDVVQCELNGCVDFQNVDFPNTVAGAGGATIQRSRFNDLPDYVARAVLVEIWRRLHWPLQAMGDAQWRRILELSQSGSPPGEARKIVLPGEIVISSESDTIQIHRP